MDNLTALRSLCNAICSTFYPDGQTMALLLFNEGLEPSDNAAPKDPLLLKLAIKLVQGYVESSRSEGGVSTAINTDKVKDNIRRWCTDYGLDADDYLSSPIVIQNGSNLW